MVLKIYNFLHYSSLFENIYSKIHTITSCFHAKKSHRNKKGHNDKEKALQTISNMSSAQIVSVAVAKGITLLHPHHIHHTNLSALPYPSVRNILHTFTYIYIDLHINISWSLLSIWYVFCALFDALLVCIFSNNNIKRKQKLKNANKHSLLPLFFFYYLFVCVFEFSNMQFDF